MNKELVERLKIAAEQFYLDLHNDTPHMSDIEYDTLSKQYESEYGKSIKTIIDWSSVDKLENNLSYKPLPKVQVTNNDLMTAAKNWIESNNINDYYINLKYDGCGVRAYYKNGKLQKVLSTPDEKFGLVKTNTLGFLFPQELDDTTIESIAGELIVDANMFGYNSRNKSNGLVNSKDRLIH